MSTDRKGAAADLLDAAANLLEQEGWCQGRIQTRDGKRCAFAAIYSVPAEPWLRPVACEALHSITGAIDTWNDTFGQTAENVIATFRTVAADLREGERGPREVSP